MTPMDSAWRKSSRSNNNGACVEVRLAGDIVQVRDSKDLATGPVLDFTHEEWQAHIEGVKAGEFELA